MAGKLNRYQMQSFQTWKGLSKESHISSIWRKMPQKAADTMIELLAFQRGRTLDSFLSQFPTKTFETDDEYTWDVVGTSERNIPLVEVRNINNNVVTSGMIGVGLEPFYLVFAEDYFADGEVIVGMYNESYPIRVLGDPRAEGTNFVYKCELMGGITEGMPADACKKGDKFSYEYAPVEQELSRKVGDIRFNSPIAMRNEFSHIRLQHKVSGKMLNKKLAVALPFVKDGKKQLFNTWMHNVEWQFELTWGEYKNKILAYGRSNRNSNGEYLNIGKSGEVIRMGDGLYAQMEVANTHYYGDFSLKLLENALYDLSYGKLDFGERYFLIRTGEKGAQLFNKAVLDTVSGWTQFAINGDALGIVSKTSSNLHTNALAAGFQFTEFRAPNGVRVKVEVDPMYDDPIRNKIQHPEGGPANSYRFDVMDIGTMSTPNIFKVKAANCPEIRGYQYGMRNPFTGQVGGDSMSWDEDSAQVHAMTATGICVLDPTRTMSLIPNILLG